VFVISFYNLPENKKQKQKWYIYDYQNLPLKNIAIEK